MQEFKNSINVLLTDWLTRADSRREKSVAQITNGSQLIGRELRDAMQSVSQEAHCLSEKNEDFVKNQHQSLQNIERDSTSKMEVSICILHVTNGFFLLLLFLKRKIEL